MKQLLLKRVNTLKHCLRIKRAIWTLLLLWLLLQKLLLSWKRSAKSKTALNKRRFEIEKATRKGGFFWFIGSYHVCFYICVHKKRLSLFLCHNYCQNQCSYYVQKTKLF